jgi:hypothetical protein
MAHSAVKAELVVMELKAVKVALAVSFGTFKGDIISAISGTAGDGVDGALGGKGGKGGAGGISRGMWLKK